MENEICAIHWQAPKGKIVARRQLQTRRVEKQQRPRLAEWWACALWRKLKMECKMLKIAQIWQRKSSFKWNQIAQQLQQNL